ncbi:MAG: NAD-dependent epimerase/dehydratase family protein [Pedobacter sp.]|nr:MAG: NAD-dependent epimerase/dehydratase family protein [Pedobacter sp.]
MKITVLVTGATGFIGAKLCLALAKEGFNVRALCRDLNHPNLPEHKDIVPFKGDILEMESLTRAIDGCEEVYHTAALAKMWSKNSDLFYQVNVKGTQNVMEACMVHQVRKVVYTSTCGVIGPTIKFPMTEVDPRVGGYPIAYERTKYLAELLVNQFSAKGLPVVTVNPSRVFGEGPITDSNTVSKMINGYLKGKWRIIPGNGAQIANYVYVNDVVRGHINAMKYGRNGEKYILGGEDICFNEFFETLKHLSGQEHRLFKVSQRLIKWFSYLELAKTKLTGLAPMFLPAFADRLKYDQKYSSAKAIAQLHYQITPFKIGMGKTITYLKNNS